jgi:hypothetical protein
MLGLDGICMRLGALLMMIEFFKVLRAVETECMCLA